MVVGGFDRPCARPWWQHGWPFVGTLVGPERLGHVAFGVVLHVAAMVDGAKFLEVSRQRCDDQSAAPCGAFFLGGRFLFFLCCLEGMSRGACKATPGMVVERAKRSVLTLFVGERFSVPNYCSSGWEGDPPGLVTILTRVGEGCYWTL